MPFAQVDQQECERRPLSVGTLVLLLLLGGQLRQQVLLNELTDLFGEVAQVRRLHGVARPRNAPRGTLPELALAPLLLAELGHARGPFVRRRGLQLLADPPRQALDPLSFA